MTTSNVTTFNQTASQIITDTYNLLGVYAPEDTVSTNDYNFALNMLNKMIKGWEGQGIHLWTSTEAALFLTLNQKSYNMASADPDIQGDYPIFNTLTSNASGTSIVVGSNTGISVNDNIGIKLDNNTLQWTTVASVNGDGVTIGLNASLTSAASAGNNVFSFTNKVDRPLYITNARFRTSSGFERPLGYNGRQSGRTEFMQIPNKDATGKANQWFYSPKVTDATFYVWPVADDVGDCITFSYMRRIQDFVNSTDTPDLPQEWLEAITLNLAPRIASAFGIDLSKNFPLLAQQAAESLVNMQLWDNEEGSLRICPSYDYWE